MTSKSNGLLRRRPGMLALLVLALAATAAGTPVLAGTVDGAATGTADRSAASTADGAAAGTADAEAEGAEPTAAELERLVGPVALYPDDLLAIVLPATTHPLQIVQAARYLAAREQEPTLDPDPDWDASVVALLNYPEVVQRLNDDLDWTAALGAAVAEREDAVLAAVTRFRRQAHRVGNLRSDGRQVVDLRDDAIAIRHLEPDVLYVPDYEPAIVRVHQPSFVYRYYARPFPVYYYPYGPGHALFGDGFWGVTSVYRIAWLDRSLQVQLLQHRAHPYHGRHYHYPYRYYYSYGFHHLDRHDRYRPGSLGTWPYPAAWPRSHGAWRGLGPRGERIEMHRRGAGRQRGAPPVVAPDPAQPAAAREHLRTRERDSARARATAGARERTEARAAARGEGPAPGARRGAEPRIHRFEGTARPGVRPR